MIYFIRCKDLVKIGYTNSVSKRFASLQTGSPYDLYLLAMDTGNRKLEKLYHRLYEKYHERGEWFRFEGKILEDVLALRHMFFMDYYTRECMYAHLNGDRAREERYSVENVLSNYWLIPEFAYTNWQNTREFLNNEAYDFGTTIGNNSYLFKNTNTKALSEKIYRGCMRICDSEEREEITNIFDAWQLYCELRKSGQQLINEDKKE